MNSLFLNRALIYLYNLRTKSSIIFIISLKLLDIFSTKILKVLCYFNHLFIDFIVNRYSLQNVYINYSFISILYPFRFLARLAKDHLSELMN